MASVVARVKAVDADIGPNAEMEYRIIEDGPGLFNITTDEDTQEGVIILQKVHMQRFCIRPKNNFYGAHTLMDNVVFTHATLLTLSVKSLSQAFCGQKQIVMNAYLSSVSIDLCLSMALHCPKMMTHPENVMGWNVMGW